MFCLFPSRKQLSYFVQLLFFWVHCYCLFCKYKYLIILYHINVIFSRISHNFLSFVRIAILKYIIKFLRVTTNRAPCSVCFYSCLLVIFLFQYFKCRLSIRINRKYIPTSVVVANGLSISLKCHFLNSSLINTIA